MNKITRKELSDLCIKNKLADWATYGGGLILACQNDDCDCVIDFSSEMIAVAEALGVEVVDSYFSDEELEFDDEELRFLEFAAKVARNTSVFGTAYQKEMSEQVTKKIKEKRRKMKGGCYKEGVR